MQRVALRDVDLASFRAAVGPEGCADGAAAVQRGAVVQMAWEASQQLLTGTVRERAAARSGRCPPRSARPPGSRCGSARATAAAPRAPTACTSPRSCSPRPTRRCCPRPRRPATAARRSALPWEQSLDSLLATPQARRRARGQRRHRERAARGRAVPGAEHAGARPLPQLHARTTGATSRPPRTPPASSSSRRGWCSRAASAAGWPATCPGPGWTTCCCADEFPAAHVRLLHELYALYRASIGQHYALLRQLLLRRLRRPEVPGPVRLRVPPAVAGPRAGARGRPALRLPGQAGHRAAAGHGGAVPRRDDRRHHAAHRPGDQDRRRRGRRSAAVHRQRGPRRRLRRPATAGRAKAASSPGSGSPGSPIRCPRSCSSSRSPTSGSSSPRPGRPRSCPGTTRGCAARPP